MCVSCVFVLSRQRGGGRLTHARMSRRYLGEDTTARSPGIAELWTKRARSDSGREFACEMTERLVGARASQPGPDDAMHA